MGLFCAETGGVQSLTPVIFPRCFFQSNSLHVPFLRIDITDAYTHTHTSIIRFARRDSNHIDISLLFKEELLFCTLLTQEYIQQNLTHTAGGGYMKKLGNQVIIQGESKIFKKEEGRQQTIALLKKSIFKPNITVALGDNLLP